MELSAYRFTGPLLVRRTCIELAEPAAWHSGHVWICYLGQKPDLCGVVLPLELASERSTLQEAYGVELLHWMRWSSDWPLCGIPVLAASFQALDSILDRTLNLLLVTKGTEHRRLPDAGKYLETFVSRSRADVDHREHWVHPEDLDRVAIASGGGAAREITYHDLANDHYSASRLWAGYRSAVAAALQSRAVLEQYREKMEGEARRAMNVCFQWEEERVKPLLNHPDVRLYQRYAKLRNVDQQYPDTPNANEIVERHIVNGLSPHLRILLVDDDFDKGLAEVILQILFRRDDFSTRSTSPHEWVYWESGRNGKPWVRFACVKTVDSAVHWLNRWGDLTEEDEPTWRQDVSMSVWERQWESHLIPAWRDDKTKPRSVSTMDDSSARPPSASTLLILDLRLDDGEGEGDGHDPSRYLSVKLKQLLRKSGDNQRVPVVMMTASRQAMTYAAVMRGASGVDGWISKEGPDIPADDSKSARAVHHLLDRLSNFAGTNWGYRPEMEWKDSRWRNDYSELRQSSAWEDANTRISSCSTYALGEFDKPTFQQKYATRLPKDWLNDLAAGFTATEKILLRRRVVVACLLRTLDQTKVQDGTITAWNVAGFNSFFPGSEGRKIMQVRGNYDSTISQYPARQRAIAKSILHPGNVTNFNHLHLKYDPAKLMNMLLIEEYDWLATVFSNDAVIGSVIEAFRLKALGQQ